MTVTPDAFSALARSSPWRWTTLHFTHRNGFMGETEAWLRRPGELLVRDRHGELHRVDERGSGAGNATIRVVVGGSPVDVPEPPPRRQPHEVDPELRPDGLVARRPDDTVVAYDDPMWQTYSWVAMLDPVELSDHVAVSDVREEIVHGRPVWRARLRAEEGYQPRCGGNCCELLWSEAGLMADFSDPSEVPEGWRGRDYPPAYDVALDVATGVVVRAHPVGDFPDAPWLEVDIHEVDANLDHLFPA